MELYSSLVHGDLEMAAHFLMLINFVVNVNNNEMICHEKFTLQLFSKLDIIYNLLHVNVSIIVSGELIEPLLN